MAVAEMETCIWREEPCQGQVYRRGLCAPHRSMAESLGVLDQYPKHPNRKTLDGHCAWDEPGDSSPCGGATISFARGLCSFHYDRASRRGILDHYDRVYNDVVHHLNDVDYDAGTAVCSECGPARVVGKPGGRQCWNAAAARGRTAHGVDYLAEAEYQAILQKQGGGCAICQGLNEDGRRLAVDHNHDTGLIRGLLCGSCNLGLGKLGDDLEGVERAIDYLLRSERRIRRSARSS